MTPLGIYGLQKHLRFWTGATPSYYVTFHQYISESFVFMELGTIAASILALKVLSDDFHEIVNQLSFSTQRFLSLLHLLLSHCGTCLWILYHLFGNNTSGR